MAATLKRDQIDEIKAQARQMVSDNSKLATLYERYKEIYFMTGGEQGRGNNIDKNDWKVTVSPNGRNAVTGMKRLLDTSEVHIKVKSKGDQAPASDKIELALKHILDQSGMFRRARVEKDLNLSAVLYGPAIAAAESVDDLIKVQKNKVYRARLEKIRTYTPFLLRALSAEESFSKWGEFGMMSHLRKYKLTGEAVKERWGVTDVMRNSTCTVYDWIDAENRVVWLDNKTDVLLAKPHGMKGMNIAARFSGGSSLFDESDQFMQSFLYAHTKGEWDKRENLFFTYLFTALFMQGLPGPLMVIDPESVATGTQTLDIDFTGGIRKIFAKAQVQDFPVIDGDVLRIKDILDSIHSESTIYKQTLGQNIQGSTFSGLAMLSSAGQLPLEDPKEAITYCLRDIFDHILCRMKDSGIKSEMLSPDEIPDDYEVEVMLEPKLPQDNLRNAQVAQQLGDMVSDQWKHENLLQISDSAAMRKQVVKEQMLKAMIGAMLQDQTRMTELINTALGIPQQQPPTPQGSPTTPPDPSMMATEGGPVPPDAAMPAQGQVQQSPMPGMEAMPATDAMPMPTPGQVPNGRQ